MADDSRTSPLSKNHGVRAHNPFHATLNFSYALLEAQVLQSITISGLDPTCGYLHPDSLVFDLVEPFRAKVDAKVFSFFQKTTFHRGDFYQLLSGECRLNEQLRRYIFASCRIEQNCIDDLVQHLTILLAP